MACTEVYKVLFSIHMMSEEADDLWDNVRQRLEDTGAKITRVLFKNEILEKYFPEDAHGKK